MGHGDAEPAHTASTQGWPAEKIATQARLKTSGRIGAVVAYDPSDNALTYKLSFADGKFPQTDWFPRDSVELLLLEGGGENADPQLTIARVAVDDVKPVDASLETWAKTRPTATPVVDEGFICAGSRAPICPRPAAIVPCGPITLGVLQGSWLGSGGAKISVLGTDVVLNGLPLNGHKVELRDDGTVVSIGRLWQLKGWTADGKIDFRCSSTQDNMDSARSDVWTRVDPTQNSGAEDERLRLLGYAGSAADPLGRGIEGCLPGTLGAEVSAKDAKEVSLLCALVAQWREPELVKVCSYQVVPDVTNRAETGLGVELCHFVASSMRDKGFKRRTGRNGHDIPVVVREPPDSKMHVEASALWKERVAEEPGFPPVRAAADVDLFTSLGNGHFFQALNLFACECEAINEPGRFYRVGADAALKEALVEGVPSIVLRHEAPRPVRAKIAELLNAKRDFQWTLDEDGTVDATRMTEDTSHCSQFEWLSKGMDAHQVNCLVRTHLGIRESRRIQG